MIVPISQKGKQGNVYRISVDLYHLEDNEICKFSNKEMNLNLFYKNVPILSHFSSM